MFFSWVASEKIHSLSLVRSPKSHMQIVIFSHNLHRGPTVCHFQTGNFGKIYYQVCNNVSDNSYIFYIHVFMGAGMQSTSGIIYLHKKTNFPYIPAINVISFPHHDICLLAYVIGNDLPVSGVNGLPLSFIMYCYVLALSILSSCRVHYCRVVK